jgi:hypothetical protein
MRCSLTAPRSLAGIAVIDEIKAFRAGLCANYQSRSQQHCDNQGQHPPAWVTYKNNTGSLAIPNLLPVVPMMPTPISPCSFLSAGTTNLLTIQEYYVSAQHR